jgi:hypothetical protein
MILVAEMLVYRASDKGAFLQQGRLEHLFFL